MDLKKEIEKNLRIPTDFREFPKNYKEIFKNILIKTNFLDRKVRLIERVYCILNDITFIPLCKQCKNNPVRYNKDLKTYATFCSQKCSTNNNETKNNRNKTMLELYGEHWQKIISKKSQNTLNVIYGITSPFQSKEFYNRAVKTWKNKYGFIIQ